ncbi:MAG: DUF1501 domain-containing protein [Abitibacteriaceae bacterium]|nr:DUF1501 domain-containing protein [Abditibacteriaceae bacterium]MBV9864953.1 DUF1501 domain-containing protein [Abditibacteriaceae bacterium]
MDREPHLFAAPHPVFATRREFLKLTGSGLGLLALAGLLDKQGLLTASAEAATALPAIGLPTTAANLNPLAPHPGHFPARAKSVIWLFMNGGPSHVDTWDYKPELIKRDGQEYKGFDKNTGFFVDQVGPIMKSPFAFKQYGKSGTWASEIFPNMSRHVDDMAFIHSCYTETNNHSPALFEINTGMNRMGFPSVGAWVTYGLGSESQNLPGFVVMYDTLGRGLPKGYAQNWGAGFLPGVYQGTALNGQGAPINDLNRNAHMSDAQQRSQLNFLSRLNHEHLQQSSNDGELAARIESFELAYRMQMAAPEALDIEKEDEPIKKLYGLDDKRCAHFGKQCLMARRLVERGVRFVQIYSGGEENEKSWDGHLNIESNHRGFAGETDVPIAGLFTDLKQRGLLDSTLVIWCGEFGRLPLVQKGGTGRDHNPHAFTTWMAGGGVKAGVHYGTTDELGHKAVENRVSINDLHATILHLLGIDHTKLTYRFNSRNYRLTDVAGEVVRDILA